jgi:hypothetical protein
LLAGHQSINQSITQSITQSINQSLNVTPAAPGPAAGHQPDNQLALQQAAVNTVDVSTWL